MPIPERAGNKDFMEMNESDLSGNFFCQDYVRRYDYDHYLCTMLAPLPVRRALMTIYAFNIELAMIRERVNEQMLGEIRFQWWRDQIEGIYQQDVRPEGVAGSLYDFIKSYAPSRSFFDSLIDSRSRDLSDDLFVDTDDFSTYCIETTVPLIRLSLLSFADQCSKNNNLDEDLIRHTAITWAATGLIRAIPVHMAQGRCMIPRSLLDRYETTPEQIFTGQEKPALRNIVKDLVKVTEEHLEKARSQVLTADPALFPAFLPLVLARFYIGNIKKADFDPFHIRVVYPNRTIRILRLLYASWRKRI